MSNLTRVLDHLQDLIVALPTFQSLNLKKSHVGRQYAPQPKNPRPEGYPAITMVYDFDNRERWAPIDVVKIFVQIEMKQFEETEPLAEEVRTKFDNYQFANEQVTIYKIFHNGGGEQPIYNKEHNTYESILEFEVRIG